MNYPLTARILIALLFVAAGIGKLMDFAGTTDMMAMMNLPLPALVAVITILVEIPVALAFAWGYKVRTTGWILAVFTLITILVAHRDVSTMGGLMAALKNLAIIGGIIGIIGKRHGGE